MNYNEIKNDIKTGDILLCHGRNRKSKVVQFLSGCKWSHVAMFIRAEDIGLKSEKELLVWESVRLGSLNSTDVLLDTLKEGPQLSDFEKKYRKVMNSNDQIAIAVRKSSNEFSEKQKNKLRDFINSDYHIKKFPDNLNLILDIYRGRIFKRENSDEHKSCSELIAETYIHLDILKNRYLPNYYAPRDFSTDKESKDFKELGFEKEVYIEF